MKVLKKQKKQTNAKIDELKKQIADLYAKESKKEYDIIHISGLSSKKYTTYFDQFKIKPHPKTTEIDFSKVLNEISNIVISTRGLKKGDKIRMILSHPEWNKPISTKLITISGSYPTIHEYYYQKSY